MVPSLQILITASDLDAIKTVIVVLGFIVGAATLAINWKNVYRSELSKKRLQAAQDLRESIWQLWFRFANLETYAKMVGAGNFSLAEFQKEEPELWQDYVSYRTLAASTFQRLSWGTSHIYDAKLPWKELE